jgi:hypothetical protein
MQLGRPRHVWADNIGMYPQDMGEGMDWINLAQDSDQAAGCCYCGNDLLGSKKCGEILE